MQRTRRCCLSNCTWECSKRLLFPVSLPTAPTDLHLRRRSEARMGPTLRSDAFDFVRLPRMLSNSSGRCRTRVSDPHAASPSPPLTPPEFLPETATAHWPPACPSHIVVGKPPGLELTGPWPASSPHSKAAALLPHRPDSETYANAGTNLPPARTKTPVGTPAPWPRARS